jgi:hypothetical protein
LYIILSQDKSLPPSNCTPNELSNDATWDAHNRRSRARLRRNLRRSSANTATRGRIATGAGDEPAGVKSGYPFERQLANARGERRDQGRAHASMKGGSVWSPAARTDRPPRACFGLAMAVASVAWIFHTTGDAHAR